MIFTINKHNICTPCFMQISELRITISVFLVLQTVNVKGVCLLYLWCDDHKMSDILLFLC